MAITSESQIIDVVAISNGCSIIEEAAQDYINCSKNIQEASEICGPEALSVEKTSMQPSLEELAASVKSIQGNIENFTSQIRNVASQIQAKQYAELAEYRAAQAAKAAAEAEARAKANSSN